MRVICETSDVEGVNAPHCCLFVLFDDTFHQFNVVSEERFTIQLETTSCYAYYGHEQRRTLGSLSENPVLDG